MRETCGTCRPFSHRFSSACLLVGRDSQTKGPLSAHVAASRSKRHMANTIRFIRWSKNLLSSSSILSSMAAQASLLRMAVRRSATAPPHASISSLRPWASRSAHVTARARASNDSQTFMNFASSTARNSKGL